VTFDELRNQAISEWDALERSDKPRIYIGTATCGRAAGALTVLEAIKSELARHSIEAIIIQVGCIGLCYAEPLVDIAKPNRPRICYGSVTPEIVPQLVEDYIVNDNPRPDLALGTLGDGSVDGIPRLFDLPMLKPQVRIALRNCGLIDPEDISQYLANGGYRGLAGALKMRPEEVVEEVKKSGLRGRGGAGFATGRKWEFCRRAPGAEKYLICNADEGDPGAFMDRALLEGDPHTVLEGMVIGAYAIGATQGYIYCRAEYPLAIERIETALKQMKEYGLLGDNILGSGFSFQMKIMQGAGAFVCGETSAMVASLEGKRGQPRSKYVHLAEHGLWDKPTLINNVETWGNVPVILHRGAEWYSSLGTETSKGTKTFALAGKIARTGLIEVPMGIPLRDIIYEIGGGIARGRRFKAVQTGGPSGGCLPASMLDLPVDYESLTQAGSIMGSGAMVVADEDTCMVDLARFFLAFTQAESCGKCVPCRLGTKQMLDILEDITNGKGKLEDIDLLTDLSEVIKSGSLCGLGQTAPNPVLTTIRYFRDEYEEHIKKHYCRAAVCKGLVTAPCSHLCPAGLDVPRHIRFITEGRFGEAVAVIREKIPFPLVCGYVCLHFCETRCRRGELDETIAIRVLHRVAVEHDTGLWKLNSRVAPATNKRVAIIGSGPAGLTAAYYLAKLGHSVTVFEALPEPGGMMRIGIPDYRLPKDVLKAEIEEVKSVGVDIRTNIRVDSLDELLEQGYNAILVAVGTHRGQKLPIPGADLDGVLVNIPFLRDVNLGKEVKVGKRVVVLGGGNVAFDCARVARRLGASEVHIACLECRGDMPAVSDEIEQGEEEGIVIHPARTFTRIVSDDGHISGVECLDVRSFEFDREGRVHIDAVEGSEHILPADTVIFAIGQRPEIPARFGLTTGRGNTIQVDPDTLATVREGVFAAGDAVIGTASVIEAIAAGRQAAISIDRYLGGTGIINETLAPPEGEIAPVEEAEEEKRRPPIPTLPLEQRLSSFANVELGLSEEAAIEEAKRCLRCDLEEKE